MNALFKSTRLLIYPSLLVMSVLIFYRTETRAILEQLQSSDQGVLVTTFNYVAQYFVHAKTWNLIFVITFMCGSMLTFATFDLSLQWMFKKIGVRFLSSDIFRYTIQKVLAMFMVFLMFFAGSNMLMVYLGDSLSVQDPEKIPTKRAALLLGTSKMLSSGAGENVYYTYRIDKAKQLYDAGKVSYFLVSGDGYGEYRPGEDYDETRDLKSDLMAYGIAEDRIKIDKSGFRTLDSILRLRSEFGFNSISVISQEFHVERALLLSLFYGIDAIGFPAKGSATKNMFLRELLAKPKVVLDILFFNMMPKSGQVDYRKEFETTSDLHVILLLVLTLLFVTAGVVMVKSFDMG
jgi:SanA protein